MNKKHSSSPHAPHDNGSGGNDPSWFERPQNINRMIYALVAICLALVALDKSYSHEHTHFDIESVWGFQAWFGFIAFVAIVFLGRGLRVIVRRAEDYYDR